MIATAERRPSLCSQKSNVFKFMQAVPFTEKAGKMQTGTATVAVLAEAAEVSRGSKLMFSY